MVSPDLVGPLEIKRTFFILSALMPNFSESPKFGEPLLTFLLKINICFETLCFKLDQSILKQRICFSLSIFSCYCSFSFIAAMAYTLSLCKFSKFSNSS